MHKGKITMLGRIMAGSQAVIAHADTGQAIFVAYYPPDIHVSHVIVAYCQQVAEGIGSVVFVIDRAVNAVALAQAFAEKDLGLLCMLDDNEHTGLGALRPPWWRLWRTGQESIAVRGKRAAKMIPATL